MSYCIYAIVDPRCDLVFYIGHSVSFKRRCEQHMQGEDSLSGLIIRQIKQNGFVPLFIKLESCKDKQSALMAEIFWIELFKSRSVKLTNCQHFSGYVERKKQRDNQGKKLEGMKRARQFESGLERLANGRPSRQGQVWSKYEDKRLLAMKRKKMPIEAIADNLDRSIAAVEMRLRSIQANK